MFDLKNCVNYDGNIYCWCRLTNSFVKIELKSVPVKDCPDMVIEEILKASVSDDTKRK